MPLPNSGMQPRMPTTQTGMGRSRRSPQLETRTQLSALGTPTAVRYWSGTPRPVEPWSPRNPDPVAERESQTPARASRPDPRLDQTARYLTDRGPAPSPAAERFMSGIPASLTSPLGFAQGGEIPPSPQDTQPAMLEPGEYVLPKWLVDDIKAGNPPGKDSSMSSGPFIPGMAQGGGVARPGAGFASVDLERLSQLEPERKLDPDPDWSYPSRPGTGFARPGLNRLTQMAADQKPKPEPPDTSFQDQLDANTAKAIKAQADAKMAREQVWGSMSAANASRKEAAIQRGSKLVRNVGEATREEHEVNTANAARSALATSSIQPMEASLSRASQMQLRSSLQGALIRTSAEIKAEEMSYHAEMQAIDGELAILSQKANAETDNVARGRYLEDMQEASRQKEYFMDKAMDAQLRLQKAQDPGFMRSMLPGLIQGAATVVGSIYGGPAGGAVAGTVAKVGTDAVLDWTAPDNVDYGSKHSAGWYDAPNPPAYQGDASANWYD